MKTRIIQTRFWDDELNDQIDIYGQHLYIYLLTCKHINICGYFQMRESLIKLETKLTDNQFKSAKQQLAVLKKVFFKDGWVWIINARKNNNYENSDDNKIACKKEIERIPSEIKKYFDSTVDSTVDSMPTVPIIHKPEIINNKYKTIQDLNKDILREIADEKHFPLSVVEDYKEDLELYCESKGKQYKNYKAALINWLNRAFREGKIKKIAPDSFKDVIKTYDEIHQPGIDRLSKAKNKLGDKWQKNS